MKKLIKIVIISLVFAGLVLSLFPLGNKTASAQSGGGQWDTEIKLSPAQYSFARESDDKLAATLQASNVSRTLTRTSLQLSGSGGVEQLNTALFDDSSPWVNFLGGPVDLTIQLPAGIEPLTLNLEARLSAGYQWELVADNQALYSQDGNSTFITRYHALGAPSIQTIQSSGECCH